MKKAFVILLVLLMVLCGVVSSVADNDKPMFMKLPWGTTLGELLNKSIVGIDWTITSNVSMYKNVEDIIGSSKGFEGQSEYGLYCETYCNTPQLNVAGYSVDRVEADFAYLVDENGKVNKTDNDAVLMAGEYRIKALNALDLENKFSDLEEKLTSLYGNYSDRFKKNNFGVNFEFIIWTIDDICIVLQTRHSISWNPSEKDNMEVYIRYGWLHADEYLKETYAIQYNNDPIRNNIEGL